MKLRKILVAALAFSHLAGVSYADLAAVPLNEQPKQQPQTNTAHEQSAQSQMDTQNALLDFSQNIPAQNAQASNSPVTLAAAEAPSYQWADAQAGLEVSADGNTLTVEEKQIGVQYSIDLTTSRITDLKRYPGQTTDTAQEGDWITIAKQISGFLSGIQSRQASQSDQASTQTQIDKVAQAITNARIAVIPTSNPNRYYVGSINVVQVWENGCFKFGIDRKTRAITVASALTDDRSVRVTYENTDYANWLDAGLKMSQDLSVNGTQSGPVYITLYVTLVEGQQAGYTFGDSQSSVTVRYDGLSIIFEDKRSTNYQYQFHIATKAILDLKTTPPTPIQYSSRPGDWLQILDQLLLQAKGIQNTLGSASDKAILQTAIDRLNAAKQQSGIRVATNDVTGASYVETPTTVEFRKYGQLVYSLTKPVAALAVASQGKPGPAVTQYSNFTLWFQTGRKMYRDMVDNAMANPLMQEAISDLNKAMGNIFIVEAVSGPGNNLGSQIERAGKYPSVVFVTHSDGVQVYLDTKNKVVYSGVFGGPLGQVGFSKNTSSQSLQYYTLVNQMLADATAYAGHTYNTAAQKTNLQSLVDLLKAEMAAAPSTTYGPSGNSITVSFDGKTISFDGGIYYLKHTYNTETKVIVDSTVTPPVTIDPAANPGAWWDYTQRFINNALNVKFNLTSASDKAAVQAIIDRLNADRQQSGIRVFNDYAGLFVESPNVVQVSGNNSLSYSLDKTTKAITYRDAWPAPLVTVTPSSNFNAWFEAARKMYRLYDNASYDSVITDSRNDVKAAANTTFLVGPAGIPYGHGGGWSTTEVAGKYPTVVFVTHDIWTKQFAYIDLQNKIAYSAAFGVNGVSKNDPAQYAQYKAIVSQMLTDANAYKSYGFSFAQDAANLQTIIDLLNADLADVPYTQYSDGNNTIRISLDGKTIRFLDGNYYLNHTFNTETKLIVNEKSVPAVTIDPAKNPGDWWQALDYTFYWHAFYIKNKLTSPADKQAMQTVIDQLAQAKQESGIRVSTSPSGYYTFVESANVVELRLYNTMKYSLNKTTKAITYPISTSPSSSGGPQLTALPSDFNAWFEAGRRMFREMWDNQTGGAGQVSTDAIADLNAAMGNVFIAGPIGGVGHSYSNSTEIAGQYSTVIYLMHGVGTQVPFYVDLQNKIIYTGGVFGVNGISKNDPYQNAQYRSLIDQLLEDAFNYQNNGFASADTRAKMQILIDLLYAE